MIAWAMNDWPIAAAILGGGSLFAVAWRTWIWPALKVVARGAVGFWHAQIKARRAAIGGWEVVQAQLTNNGGGSLLDKVDALVEGVDTLGKLLAEHTGADDVRFKAMFLRLGIVPGEAEATVAKGDGDDRS